jgi:D-alanyl-lipoteichoic acid acyltransferase DltB (MBOAT superfamily)
LGRTFHNIIRNSNHCSLLSCQTHRSIRKSQNKKNFLILSLIINLGTLGFFKYYNFFTHSLNELFSVFGQSLDFLHINIILPVGISFFTFQSLSYTIDVYLGKIRATDSLIDLFLFKSFFPQLVAGPIERATNLLPQISKLKPANVNQFKEGIVLISIGMFKKVIIGDTSGKIVDHIFAEPQYYSSLELVMGLILFSVQIYADFSGYSSIARGTAKLFGIELMINFRQPYLAQNISDFWRRWHISLSTWLKDYLYIPLGGNRKGKIRTHINLMITMLLGGLWHGANWTFVAYGTLHGIYLSINRLFYNRQDNAKKKNIFVIVGSILVTNLLVLFTRIFFRSENFNAAFYYIEKIFNWTSSEFTARVITIFCSYAAITILIDIVEEKTNDQAFLLKLNPELRYGVIAASWFIILLYMFQAEPLPFVYFQF